MTVQELFDLVLPRLTGDPVCSVLDAVREVQAIIVSRLMLRRSDMLGDSLIGGLPVNGKYVYLDDTLIALSSRPYVVGGAPLSPLNNKERASLQEPGTPRYFSIVGKRLEVLPPTDTKITLQIPAFVRPERLTSLSETLPFFGEVDGVFVEGCVGVLGLGLSVVASKEFVAVVQSQIDQVLLARDLAAEQLTADGINQM